MKRGQYKLNIYGGLESIALYNLYVPTRTISRVFGVNNVTLWKTLKRYEKMGLVKVRYRSETVLLTLSKRHTEPEGNSEIVREWKESLGVEGLRDLLTVILVTDGHASLKHKTISLTNSDKILLDIFVDLLRELKLDVRETLDKRNNLKIMFARSNKVKHLLKSMKNLTPTTKHQPARGKQTWKDYLKEDQPTISFLFERSDKLRQLAFRLAMSFEGCAMTSVTSDRLTRPCLSFTCFHPNLIKEWKQLAGSIGIKMSNKGKFLYTVSLDSILTFMKIGGFIEGVVNTEKSRYFTGIEKNKILLGILEYFKREREGEVKKTNYSKKVNKKIRQIIDNNELGKPEFYIKYFSDIFTKYHGIQTREQILKVLGNGPKTIKELVNETGLKEQCIRSMFPNLFKERLIERIKHGTYSIRNDKHEKQNKDSY